MKMYCTQNYGDCVTCSLSQNGRDCRDYQIGTMYRSEKEDLVLTEQEYFLYSLRKCYRNYQQTDNAKSVGQLLDEWISADTNFQVWKG